jgi:signal transduction histidine kinase
MISELLDFTRGSHSTAVLAPTNYAEFIEQLIEEVRPELSDKRVMITCESDPPGIKLLLDPPRLMRVFFNLINNAVDVMPDGGSVRLRFQAAAEEVVTEIEDSGPGIAPEIAPRMFQPFATHGKSHGTGLGLSICRRIIEDHHGRINAKSEPGRGALFFFTLPIPEQRQTA